MSYLEAAMRDGGVVTRDGRGLMPLDEARALLAGVTVFERGAIREIGGGSVLDADRLWAALLSLADASEFNRVASGLTWEHPPRGRNNDAPFARYGDGVLPWLSAALGGDGRFPSRLWAAIPCLLRIGGPDALALVRRVKRVGLLAEWLDAHPEGFEPLAAQAEQGDDSARAALLEVAGQDPAAVSRALGAARAATLGLPQLDPAIEAALAGVAAPSQPPPAGRPLSMARVSACVRNFELPMWDNANYFIGAMRVTGFASPHADALVFQALVTGLGKNNFRREITVVTADGARCARMDELVSEGAIWDRDGDATTCLATGVRRQGGVYSRTREGAATLHIPAVGAEVPCSIDTTGMNPAVTAVFSGRSVEEGLLVRLGQDHGARVFLPGPELAAAAELDPEAQELFTFDGFQTPLSGQAATEAPDLVAMVEALRRRLPLQRLPVGGHPLGNLFDRLVVDALAWGDPRFVTG